MNLKYLSEPFPKQSVHWRAQSIRRDGTAALALAYLDARDVMDRLDLVCGQHNWQDSFAETAKGRVLCKIGIKVGDDWVWKSDGAGETAVEGEKGGISDALKRAAVHWGVGRYLYRLGAPWVPCETWKNNQGKMVFSKWTENPWDHVKNAPIAPEETAREIFAKLNAGEDPEKIQTHYAADIKKITTLVPDVYQGHILPLLTAKEPAT